MRKMTFAAVTIHTILLLGMATLAVAAADGGHASDEVLLKDFLYRCLNFSIVVGILAYFILKPIKKALSDRKENVVKTLEEARNARAEAEARYRDVEARLRAANEDIEEVYFAIRQEGEAERRKIIANARAMAEKIQTEAKNAAQREVENARFQLRAEVASLAVKLAEQLIRKNISPEDHDRLLNDYIKSVGELH